MPRIRTIKPEFWSDEKLSLLDPITRLVFLGLISMADDAGRLVDNVKQIDGMIFPNTADTCRESLITLARLGRIIRYTSASGQDLIQVTKWKEHQKVDKPAKYVLPGPTSAAVAQAVAAAKDTDGLAGTSRDPREDLAGSSRSDLRPTNYDHGPVPGSTTSGDLDQERGGRRRVKELVAQLPPGAREFGKHFYRSAPRDRQIDVMEQLLATLNGGAEFSRGVTVSAGSPERLSAKCRQVIDEGVKDPDKAIVVLLRKLGDVGNAQESPTEKAAAASAASEDHDHRVGAERLTLALAWLEANPERAKDIDDQVSRELGPEASGPIRTVFRNSVVARAWLAAGEPIVQPTGSS